MEDKLNKHGYILGSPEFKTYPERDFVQILRKTTTPLKKRMYMFHMHELSEFRYSIFDLHGNIKTDNLVRTLSMLAMPKQDDVKVREIFGFCTKNKIVPYRPLVYAIRRTDNEYFAKIAPDISEGPPSKNIIDIFSSKKKQARDKAGRHLNSSGLADFVSARIEHFLRDR